MGMGNTGRPPLVVPRRHPVHAILSDPAVPATLAVPEVPGGPCGHCSLGDPVGPAVRLARVPPCHLFLLVILCHRLLPALQAALGFQGYPLFLKHHSDLVVQETLVDLTMHLFLAVLGFPAFRRLPVRQFLQEFPGAPQDRFDILRDPGRSRLEGRHRAPRWAQEIPADRLLLQVLERPEARLVLEGRAIARRTDRAVEALVFSA